MIEPWVYDAIDVLRGIFEIVLLMWTGAICWAMWKDGLRWRPIIFALLVSALVG